MQNNFLQTVKKTPPNGSPKGKTCLKMWFTKIEKMFLFLTLFNKLKQNFWYKKNKWKYQSKDNTIVTLVFFNKQIKKYKSKQIKSKKYKRKQINLKNTKANKLI